MSYHPRQSQSTQENYPRNHLLGALPRIDSIPMTLPRAANSDADDIDRSLLAVYSPDLVELSGRVLRSQLLASSKKFMNGLHAVRVPQTVQRNLIPMTFIIPVQFYPSNRDTPPAIYPTHILAVSPPPASSRQTPADGPVALTAVHGMIIAANCTKLALPPPAIQPSDPRFVSLATHCMTVCSIPAFVILRLYMYSRRIDSFMDAMMPFPPAFLETLKPQKRCPGHEGLKLNAARQSVQQTRYLADHLILCTPGGPYPMWERIRMLQGIWQTMCDLGMYEQLLWQALDLAWQVARYALSVVSEQHGKALAAEAARR
ncbi:hypothetical protein C8R45DRAFT_1025087 [Mycena sanguinolenta]|nr:hypothetical protein C8R45DRAFT_1025087 [Mycena sanguinolenta]